MKKLIHVAIIAFALGLTLLLSCTKDEQPEGPPKVGIFFSIADRQVAFTALTKRVVKWNWDFGDGETSTEQNPVHVYANGGYYTVTLTGTDAAGTAISSESKLAVALTPYVLLTGGPTATNGKTWKMTANHTSLDKFVKADAGFSLAVPSLPSLPVGVFGLSLGMGEVYEDEFTFFFDGRYSHDTKADKAAFSGLLYQFVTTGGAGIVNDGGADYGLCTGKYTPQAGARFTYVEKEDLTVSSVYGAGGMLTYKNVTTLDFTGTEFVGFMDFQRKVIVQEVTDKSMRLVMFMAASQSYIGVNTHALILTFVPVN